MPTQIAIAIADGILRLRERKHLGVRRGVLEQFDMIVRPRNDSPFPHHDRAHGHFLRRVGLGRLPQRLGRSPRGGRGGRLLFKSLPFRGGI